MTRTSRPGGRRPLLVAVLLPALLGPSPTTAHAATVPDDVTEWFTEVAAATATAVWPGPDDAGSRVSAGEPRPLYQWSEEFRSGAATDEPVTAVEEWIAPVTSAGEPAGVVVAWRHEGEIALAYTEEDAALAAAIAGLPGAALVVHEPVIGAHFAVDDGTVSTLRSSTFPSTGPLPLADFQPVLTERVAEMSLPDEPEGGSRWWLPAVWVALGGLVLAGLVLVAAAAWRRRGHA